MPFCNKEQYMRTLLIVSLLCLLLFGCKKESFDKRTLSSTDNNLSPWVFLALVALAIFDYLLYVWERENRRDAISKIQKKVEELSAELERQHQKIIEQGNLITFLRCRKTDENKEANSDPWGRIKKGMTEEEVINILGSPMAIFPTPNGDMHYYGQADMEGQIFFEDGKLAYYAKPRVDKKLTDLEVFRHLYKESLPTKKENCSYKDIQTSDLEVNLWDKIEKGMSEEEVVKLVGKPHKIQALNDADELWCFGPPYLNRQIIFSCGKVVGFEKGNYIK